jgi:hypothetical protein
MLYGVTVEETVITSQVDGVAVSAAATPTSLLPAAAKFLLPANWCAIGKKILIKASGRISSVITTPGTARFDLRLGGTVVFDSLAILLDTVAGHTNVHWGLQIELYCRGIGAAANFFPGECYWRSEDLLGTPAAAPKGCLAATLPWNTAPAIGANFDSTINQVMDLFFTQTVPTGSCLCHTYAISLQN